MNTKNMVIAISGGTRGIGYETTTTLLKKGYKLAVIYEKRDDIANDLKKTYGNSILLYKGNISNEADVEEFYKKTLEKFGKIDILINNAAISQYGFLCDEKNEKLKEVLDVNIYGTLILTKMLIPSLLKTKGLIINISSIWGNRGASCEIAYSMSKGAINQLTSSLARELSPSGIRVVGIAPGLIETTMNDDLDLRDFLGKIPLERMGKPKEVVTLIEYLIEKDTYINGTTIIIDGGYSIN